MRAFLDALRHTLLFLALILLAGCAGKKGKVLVLVADNHATINLFGFEESELHHIHNTVELHRNVFLVRYDAEKPDQLKWVNCPVAATYSYRQANGRRVESMYVRSFQELQAKVPVNYARFAGQIKNGKSLEFNYVTIGSYELIGEFKIPKDDPDCEGATHYVVTLSVGAFNFSEEKALQGGLEVSEKTTGAGVGVSAGRGAGEATQMGDLDSCMDDKAALNDCFTPLQVLMMPLAARHWEGNTAVEPAPVRTADASSSGGPARQVNTDLSLQVDEAKWRPGSFMAMALERLLLMATRVDNTTDFGFDDKGSTVVAGFLRPEHPQHFTRVFEAGKTYAVIGAGATEANIDVVVKDPSGNVIAADTEADGTPAVTFTAPTEGSYRIELSVVNQAEEFGALVIMQEGGLQIEAETLQKVFQRLLDSGAFASGKVQELGFPNGLVFHETDWALQGTVLYPDEAIRQTGITLGGNSAVFVAVSHEESFNIDLEVINANTGETSVDHEPDSNPIVIVDSPDPNTSYDLRVIYGQGDSATLATSLILVISD
ncbi:hypothetical protein DB30_07992 [Enhygromyxa salina]|uniref:Uncharacterized protein n=1 Tax=Enhygromyxa salina TaxID=215803 RepID=A0A0C1Z7C7_9BACT|nr:hypothetical protein [Enhygromyxa salina]KIG13544.1 hypothetical protein DB30_07992 [Enhygromyxa salina]